MKLEGQGATPSDPEYESAVFVRDDGGTVSAEDFLIDRLTELFADAESTDEVLFISN